MTSFFNGLKSPRMGQGQQDIFRVPDETKPRKCLHMVVEKNLSGDCMVKVTSSVFFST